jgi:hypothetical protein
MLSADTIVQTWCSGKTAFGGTLFTQNWAGRLAHWPRNEFQNISDWKKYHDVIGNDNYWLLDAFAKFRKANTSFVMSVRPSARKNLCSH